MWGNKVFLHTGTVLDVMNGNAITSIAMLSALWQSKSQDFLSLLQPFVLYAVYTTTKVGEEINIKQVCAHIEQEFGYKTFHPAVASKILNRLTSTRTTVQPKIRRESKRLFLAESVEESVLKFTEKRKAGKVCSDAVSTALSKYLNENGCKRRTNFSPEEAGKLLVSFFERNGNTILLSVDDFIRLRRRDNEIDYFIGLFIINENREQTLIWDYILELVQGYFISTALYLQAENSDISSSRFKDVVFYLDTRLLLALLGYKTAEENGSIQELKKTLEYHGAKFSCFLYNLEEVNSILEAYKMSRINPRRSSGTTLEKFDENNYSFSQVEAVQQYFRGRLEGLGIHSIDPMTALEDVNMETDVTGIIDETWIENKVKEINPSYYTGTLPDDLRAINTVSRLRGGREIRHIEQCKAVFVTTNTVLSSAVFSYNRENSRAGFPLSMTVEELCVIAWLKSFEKNSMLPEMRLLENAMAAVSPSKELRDAYIEQLEVAREQDDGLTDGEIALLRTDKFVQQELMRLTRGNRENVDQNVIFTVRKLIRTESQQFGHKVGFDEGRAIAEKEGKAKRDAENRARVNKACANAETEAAANARKWLSTRLIISYIIMGLATIALISMTALVFWRDSSSGGVDGYFFCALILSLIATVQTILPITKKDNVITRFIRKRAKDFERSEADRLKDKYTEILEVK